MKAVIIAAIMLVVLAACSWGATSSTDETVRNLQDAQKQVQTANTQVALAHADMARFRVTIVAIETRVEKDCGH